MCIVLLFTQCAIPRAHVLTESCNEKCHATTTPSTKTALRKVNYEAPHGSILTHDKRWLYSQTITRDLFCMSFVND